MPQQAVQCPHGAPTSLIMHVAILDVHGIEVSVQGLVLDRHTQQDQFVGVHTQPEAAASLKANVL